MRIRDIMSTNVVSSAPNATVAAARERLQLRGIHHLIVLDGKKLVGAVSDRDLSGVADDVPLARVMVRELNTIDASATLREAAGILDGAALGCLPVFDHDKLVGVVTMRDLVRALAKGTTHANPPAERRILRKRGPRKHHVLL